jgi:2-polyprenyl-6-methoxyphenol hydroxylase-like FAD-dependent oxidoreductase
MFLALLLARQGVEVTLLEMHADFDRDFRGDTIHPTTLEIIDHLGFSQALHELPHSKLFGMTFNTPQGPFTMADFRRLPTKFPYIMMLPQADFLAFLAQQAKRFPNLRIVMNARVDELIREDKTIVGVHYKIGNEEHSLRADLVVGADGRFSKIRKLVGFEPIRSAPPMDVVWFRVPRRPEDPSLPGGTFARGRIAILLERKEEWQVAFLIPKGGYQALRTAGIEPFRQDLLALYPWLGERVNSLDWSDLIVLAVESSRLKRWYLPGLLLIGDAAHVMSPVGGVGINYAIQDAVAAANLLTEPLLRHEVKEADLRGFQRRREWAVWCIQTFQGFMQKAVIARGIDSHKPFQMPLPLRILLSIPVLRDIPARIVGLGFGRERPRSVRKEHG